MLSGFSGLTSGAGCWLAMPDVGIPRIIMCVLCIVLCIVLLVAGARTPFSKRTAVKAQTFPLSLCCVLIAYASCVEPLKEHQATLHLPVTQKRTINMPEKQPTISLQCQTTKVRRKHQAPSASHTIARKQTTAAVIFQEAEHKSRKSTSRASMQSKQAQLRVRCSASTRYACTQTTTHKRC
eukprot:m.24271 g.24271  ORF g.24271 m.24271 type:complete len:181 (-) comp8580_c1_seq1:192-734(-)